MINKTRNLSPIEYVKRLEIEWWICNFRRKICKSKDERARYGRIANLKKERLISICERNQIPHIFSQNDLMEVLNKFFTKSGGGCPDFEGLTSVDIQNYYSKGSDVRCFYGFDEFTKKAIIKIGKIMEFFEDEKKVEIIFSNEDVEVLELRQVSRIF